MWLSHGIWCIFNINDVKVQSHCVIKNVLDNDNGGVSVPLLHVPGSKCAVPWSFPKKYREYFYIIIKCWVACGSLRIAAASSSIITGGLVTGTNSVRYSAHGATPSILRITQSSHQINWKMSRQLKIYHVCTISKFSLWPSVSWISPQCRACDIKIKNIYWDGRSKLLLGHTFYYV